MLSHPQKNGTIRCPAPVPTARPSPAAYRTAPLMPPRPVSLPASSGSPRCTHGPTFNRLTAIGRAGGSVQPGSPLPPDLRPWRVSFSLVYAVSSPLSFSAWGEVTPSPSPTSRTVSQASFAERPRRVAGAFVFIYLFMYLLLTGTVPRLRLSSRWLLVLFQRLTVLPVPG